MKKVIETELYFEHIDCAACAAKIETLLNKDENIIQARVNFISKKIILSYYEGIDIVSLAENISRKIEVDAIVSTTPLVEEEHHHHHDHECECEHHQPESEKHHHDYECECEHHQSESEKHHHDYECECGHHQHQSEEHHQKHSKSTNKDSKLLLIFGVIFTIIASCLKYIFDTKETIIIARCLYVVAYLLLAYKII